MRLEPGLYPGTPEPEYRAARAMAFSDLTRWVDGKRTISRESSVIGSLLHCAVLEPQEVKNRYHKMTSDLDLRTKENRLYVEEARKQTGKEPVKPSEVELVANMRRAIMQHDKARRLLESVGEVECAWVARLSADKDYPLSKGLIDKIAMLPSGKRAILDIKTTGSQGPDEFLNSIVRFRYDAQLAYYREGFVRVTDGEWPEAAFICVSKQPPYDVWILKQTGEQFATGTRWWSTVLRLYARTTMEKKMKEAGV